MRSSSRSTVCIVLGVIAASPAGAMAGVDNTHPCAAIENDGARLTCYDHAFAPPSDPVSAPAKSAAGTDPSAEFGFTAAQSRESDPPAHETDPDSVTASVRKLDHQPRGRFIATLDNDQVWVQRETNSRARLEAGDAVTIRKAALGSYVLVTPEGIATRVHRLK